MLVIAGQPGPAGPAVNLSRPSTSLRHWKKTWMPGPRPGMTWRGLRELLRCLRELAVEGQAELVTGDLDLLTVLDRARENHFRERILYEFLNHAL